MCHDVSVGGDEFVFRGAIKLAGLHRKRRFVLRGSWLGSFWRAVQRTAVSSLLCSVILTGVFECVFACVFYFRETF